MTESEFEEQIESFFTVTYSPISPIVSVQEVNFYNSETQEVYLRFKLSKSCPVSMRLQQLNKFGYDPLTYLLVDIGRKAVVSGERNDEGCFGVEETSTFVMK